MYIQTASASDNESERSPERSVTAMSHTVDALCDPEKDAMSIYGWLFPNSMILISVYSVIVLNVTVLNVVPVIAMHPL